MGADDPQGGAIFDPRGMIAKWFNTCDCCGNVLNLDIGIWQATEWVFKIFDFHNVFQFPPLILTAKVEPLHGKTNNLHRQKQRHRSASQVTAKLINAFVFATQIVQFLYFLNPKFPASNLTIFCDCTARFVSDLGGTQIVGFLTHRLKFKELAV